MRLTTLGPFENVSRLTLGGGGLGQIWGETTRDEAMATITAAMDAGINLIDTAPRYGSCEALIGEAFAGTLPKGVKITTKCQLGAPPPAEVAERLETSLDASLERLRLDSVDVYFLHNYIFDPDEPHGIDDARRARFMTPWDLYVEEVIPAFESLRERGRIRAWGITGVGLPSTIVKALNHDIKPAVVQAVSNLMDSPGGMHAYSEPARPRDIIAEAVRNGVGVMGIRAVQAGALTDAIDRPLDVDHPEMTDFRAASPFRQLCAELGLAPAAVAHRYALTMGGVDTVVLGVKNRKELEECVAAEAEGALSSDLMSRIDELGLAAIHG